MALREILAKFGFDFDKQKLKDVNGQVDQTTSLIKTAVGLFAGHALFHGIKSFVEDIEHTGSALKDLEEQTGQSAETIQLFQFGAGLAGVQTEEWDAATRKLALSLGKAGDGSKEQAAAFKTLGVATTDAQGHARSLNDVLPELVEGFGKIEDPSKKAGLAVDLFGRAGVKLVGFLGEGSEGLAKLQQEFAELGGGFSGEAIQAADDYGDNVLRINIALKSLKSVFATEILPALSSGAVMIARWIGYGRKFVATTHLAKSTMIALGVAGVVAISSLLAPFLPVIAAVTTLSLLLDDLLGFLNGDDSVIGDALNKFIGPGGAAKVRNYLNDIGDQIKNFFTDIIQHPKEFFDRFQKIIDDFVKNNPVLNFISGGKGAAGIFNTKNDSIGAVLDSGVGGVPMPPEGDPVAEFKQLWSMVGSSIERDGKAYQKQLETGVKPEADVDWFSKLANGLFGGNVPTMAGVPGLPTTAAVPGQAANTIEQQNKISITVQAGTPDETSRAVEQGATNALGNERRAALAALENNR